MKQRKTFIIAEAGVNHNGSLALAYNLIEAAKDAGADAVKFQTFKTEKIVTAETRLAEYQAANIGSNQTQYEMIKQLELPYDDFILLKKHADKIGIMFLSTPDDEESLDFLVDSLNVPIIKVGSGEITNLEFLKKIARKQIPIILSTGMSNLAEVERAVRIVREVNQKNLTLLHCTTTYPCPANEVNLNAIRTLKTAFNLDVGYSDHTIGSEVAIASVVLGAKILEKHITLDNTMDGPDHIASMNPSNFSAMVSQIRFVEHALGDGVKWPTASEERIKPLMRRRVVARHNLITGNKLSLDDFEYKRADSGIFAEDVDQILSFTPRKNITKDAPINWVDLV